MRKFGVSVIPKSSKRAMEWLSDSEAKVWVNAAPEKGKANKEVRRVIAEHLNVKPSRVRIVSGETSSKKIVEVDV
ncbi:MAG: DUF167 domain-containing protein [Candidatus Poribacteria bacterium]|nr:DUF167 domain-containing protein [Candidatus Poribacteria bacterium]